MSQARVLSAKQQRKTLANAKKKKKAPVRNVYGHPRKEYWPVLNAEDEIIVLNMLRKLIPAYKIDQTAKQSVKTSSGDSNNSLVKPQEKGDCNQLVIGLCKVISEIENGTLQCLLLANEVDPPSLGHIVGNLAAVRNIPFVAVSNLKNCLEGVLGFKSWCVGFKVSTKHFDPICDKIKSILNNVQQESQSQQEPISSMETAHHSCGESSTERKPINISKLYFYRSDKSKRMFIPESSSTQDEGSFLSFSEDTSGATVLQTAVPFKFKSKSGLIQRLKLGSKQNNQSPRYFDKVELQPLQVKRFQENPNKQQWKKSKNRALENSKRTG